MGNFPSNCFTQKKTKYECSIHPYFLTRSLFLSLSHSTIPCYSFVIDFGHAYLYYIKAYIYRITNERRKKHTIRITNNKYTSNTIWIVSHLPYSPAHFILYPNWNCQFFGIHIKFYIHIHMFVYIKIGCISVAIVSVTIDYRCRPKNLN